MAHTTPALDHHTLLACLERASGLAAGIAARRGATSDWRDDFRGEAMLAVVEAAERFDRDAGATLTTFAYHRMVGSVLDRAKREQALRRFRQRQRQPDSAATPQETGPLRAASDVARLIELVRPGLDEVEREVLDQVHLADRTLIDVARARGWSRHKVWRANGRLMQRLRLAAGLTGDLAETAGERGARDSAA
jgi:RNA polymerase sigma factor (sigma-70 family)